MDKTLNAPKESILKVEQINMILRSPKPNLTKVLKKLYVLLGTLSLDN
jgi:hypothetical protein